ncbi:MAG TPA: ABC transporter permease [Thermodesulfobacteriota bacterium]|nr:ABC transporter permease [Thermodesulfobacteriota bacterium]
MLWNALLLALREIRRNVMRSSLTILGIVIGVAAVIIMVTIGNGATARVTEEIASLGSNLLILRPGQRLGPGQRSEAAPFDIEDVEAIARDIGGVFAVAPSSVQPATAIYGNLNWNTTVTGTDNHYLTVRNHVIASGREFSENELRAGRAICIIGETVRKELFGSQDPLGGKIRLGKLSCEVIGVLASKGQSMGGSDQDDTVLVPLRTLWRRIAGNQEISHIHISAREGVTTEKVQRDIELLMRERRRVSAGEEDDFSVLDMKEISEALTGSTEVLTSLLGTVAAVSLLVGGIGIMNIMLVSVTERTREIGVRLAIGALEREVLMQFLVEAVVLSSLGGVLGIVLALAASSVLTDVMRVPYVFDPWIIVIAVIFSAGIGVIFGYFPARKAAQLNPIDALRHE